MPEALSERVLSLSKLSWHMSWLLYAGQNSSHLMLFHSWSKIVDFYDSGFLLLALFCMAVSWKSLLWVTLGVSDVHEIYWEPLELVLQNEWVSCCEHGGQYADVSLHDNLCFCMVHSQVLLFGCVGDDSFSSRCYWTTCLKVSSEEVMWYYSKMVIDVTWKVVNHSRCRSYKRLQGHSFCPRLRVCSNLSALHFKCYPFWFFTVWCLFYCNCCFAPPFLECLAFGLLVESTNQGMQLWQASWLWNVL